MTGGPAAAGGVVAIMEALLGNVGWPKEPSSYHFRCGWRKVSVLACCSRVRGVKGVKCVCKVSEMVSGAYKDMLRLVEWCQGGTSVLSWCQAGANVLFSSIFLLTSLIRSTYLVAFFLLMSLNFLCVSIICLSWVSKLCPYSNYSNIGTRCGTWMYCLRGLAVSLKVCIVGCESHM